MKNLVPGQKRPPEHKQTTFNSRAGVKGEKYQIWITCPRTELVQQCESEAAVPYLFESQMDSISKLLCLGSSQSRSPSASYGTEEQKFGSAGNHTESARWGSDSKGLG